MNFYDIMDIFDDFESDNYELCDIEDNDFYKDNIPNITILSPPISMPSLSKGNNCSNSTSSFTFNDSDLRESNFLRRMRQTRSEDLERHTITSNDSIDKLIRIKSVCTKPSICSSNLKLKLGNNSSIDENFMKRASNRRIFKSKNQSSINQTSPKFDESTLNYYETCEVW